MGSPVPSIVRTKCQRGGVDSIVGSSPNRIAANMPTAVQVSATVRGEVMVLIGLTIPDSGYIGQSRPAKRASDFVVIEKALLIQLERRLNSCEFQLRVLLGA